MLPNYCVKNKPTVIPVIYGTKALNPKQTQKRTHLLYTPTHICIIFLARDYNNDLYPLRTGTAHQSHPECNGVSLCQIDRENETESFNVPLLSLTSTLTPSFPLCTGTDTHGEKRIKTSSKSARSDLQVSSSRSIVGTANVQAAA